MTNQAWREIIAAYGGDETQAEAEVTERLEALQALDPNATRESVIERLAWELRPRTIEHVFPGDNWYFLLKAAQSSAHILLLEDEAALSRLEDVGHLVAPALGHGVLPEKGKVFGAYDLAAEGTNERGDDGPGDLLARGRNGVFDIKQQDVGG